MATNPFDQFTEPNNPFDKFDVGAPKKSTDGQAVSGFKRSFQEVPGMLAGVGAYVADVVGADAARDSMLGYAKRKSDEVGAAHANDAQSITDAWDGKVGWLDFLANASGYVAGQAIQSLLTGGMGALGAKMIASQGAKQLAEATAAKAIAAGAGEEAAKVAAANAVQAAANKAITRGAVAGAGAQNFSMELGSIYPDAVEQAEKDGRTLDGGDKFRVFAAASLAAGVDTAGEAIMATRMLKGSGNGAKTILGRAAKEVPAGMAREAGTEAIQTGIEQWGAAKPLDVREIVDSAGIGAVGGALGGAAASRKARETAPKPGVADVLGAPSVDSAISAAQGMLALPAPASGVASELVDGVLALPGPAKTAEPPMLRALPAPDGSVVYMADAAGNIAPQPAAARAEAVTRAAEADIAETQQRLAERQQQTDLGMTPGLRKAQATREDGNLRREPIPAGEATEVLPTGEVQEFEVAPVGEATEFEVLPVGEVLDGDLMAKDGEPFTSKTGAQAKAYASGGGKVVTVPDHFGSGIPGYVVRPLVQARPNNTRGTNADDVARPDGQRPVDPRRGDRAGVLPDSGPSDVLPSPAGAAGQGVAGPGAAGGANGRTTDALTTQTGAGMFLVVGGQRYPVANFQEASEKARAASEEAKKRNGGKDVFIGNLPIEDAAGNVIAHRGVADKIIKGPPVQDGAPPRDKVLYDPVDAIRADIKAKNNARTVDAEPVAPKLPAPSTAVADPKANAPYYVRQPGTGKQIPVPSPEAAAQALGELAARTGAKPVDGSIDVYDAQTGLPAYNVRPDGTVKKVETREEAESRSGRMIEDERRTVDAAPTFTPGTRVTLKGESYTVTAANNTALRLQGADGGTKMVATNSKTFGQIERATGNQMLDNPASWVIREKATGKVVMETFDRAKVDALNTEKYEAVPAAKYLGELNGKPQEPNEAARPQAQAAAGESAAPAAAPAPAATAVVPGATGTGVEGGRLNIAPLTPEQRTRMMKNEVIFDAHGPKGEGARAAWKESVRAGAMDRLWLEFERITQEAEAAQKAYKKSKSDDWKAKNLPGLVAAKIAREDALRKAQQANWPQPKQDSAAAQAPPIAPSQAPASPSPPAPKPPADYRERLPRYGRVSSDDPSIWGEWLLGYEGEQWAKVRSMAPPPKLATNAPAPVEAPSTSGAGAPAAVAPATHKDQGEPAEPVTPAVVREAINTGGQATDRKPSAMKAELLAKIDAAMADAKGEDDTDVRVYEERSRAKVDKKALDRRGLTGVMREKAEQEIQRRIQDDVNKAAERIGYTTFSVPGDGVFKVLNTKDRLAEFRRKVEQSPGFKDRQAANAPERVNGRGNGYSPNAGERFGVESGSGGKVVAFDNMVNEGDLEAASDYADAVGLELDPKKIGNATKVLKWRESRPAATEAPAEARQAPSAAPTDDSKAQAPTDPATEAAAILNAAAEPPKGAERLSVIKDVKAGAITPEEVAAAYPAATTGTESLNKRHSVPKKQILTPAGALKADATNSRADSAVWYYQGDIGALQFKASVTVNGEPDSGADDAKRMLVQIKAAQDAGWRRASYRAGSLGTVWVYERGNEFLTRAGMENAAAVEVQRPVLPDDGPGYDKMVARQRVLARAFNDWLLTLPEDQQYNRGVVSRKLGETPVGEWAGIGDDPKLGLTLRYFPGPDEKQGMAVGWSIQTQSRADWQALRDYIAELAAEAPADSAQASQAPAPTPAAPTTPTEADAALWKKVTAGEATPHEFKAGFEAWVANKAAILVDLSTKTKAELLKMGGDWFASQYKNDPKPEIVDAVWRQGASAYTLGRSFQYGMGKDSYTNGIRRMVEATDADQLAQYVADRKAEQEQALARVAKMAEAIKDPKTLADYNIWMRATMEGGKTFKEARFMLTPEQRAAYDELAAEVTRPGRKAKQDAERTTVRAAGQTTAGEIIATKHTRDGHDLWVVKLSDRVSKDDYVTLLAGAKRLGGNYSSFRGNGAVPGFQFRTPDAAQAFLKLAGGDTAAATEVAQERRNAFDDDRSQSAAERLTEMADRLEERADESMGRDRKANTDRRAQFAASAEASARADKAMAKTMRNIASAITGGGAKFLDRVRQKVQVELLQGYVRTAQGDELRAKYPTYAEQQRNEGAAPTFETADYAEFPTFTAYRSDLASLGRQLLEVDGTKKLGERIMKVADDVSDAFTKFAKDNFSKVAVFSTTGGGVASFGTKDAADAALARSGLKGKGIAYQVKRGQYTLILSPSEAMARGIWKGDGDKRITLDPDFAGELVEKIGRVARRGAKVSVPWQFETAYDRRKQLARMGIETPAEFRAALREFIAMREQPAEPDKIKAMERAMVGRRNDGLDFFPTPEGTADEMVAAADIQPGMRVLEPSAGMGHIAERIRASEVEPDVGEFSAERRELLEAKGFNVVAQDFMALTEGGYDRILMNPPFSDGRDIQHVRHAYDLLKPGGRLVAIMGESAFFNQNKRATEFREWLESVGGTDEKLPEGTFNDPNLPVQTGANARMVVIEKPAGETGPRSIIDGPAPDAQFSRAPGRSVELEAADAVGREFWRKIDNGESFTDQEVLDALSINRRGSRRNARSMLSAADQAGTGQAVVGWQGNLAGFGAYTSRASWDGDNFNVFFVPDSLAAGADLNDDEQARDRALVHMSFRSVAGGKYELSFNDPQPGTTAKAAAEQAGIADIAGTPEKRYIQIDLSAGDVLPKAIIQEGARRLALNIGRTPDVMYAGRDTGARAGKNTGPVEYSADTLRDKFSRAQPGRQSVPMGDAKAVIAAIREALPTAPAINIHDSVKKAPENLRRLIRQAGADNDVEAVYHEGEIHVFPGNIASIERMQFVVAHHEVRHHGLRSMLGPAMGPAMLRMYASNPNLKAAADQKMADGLADTRVLAVEEALADMPVEELQKLTGWQRIVSAARQWLRQAAANLRRAGLTTLADAIEPEGWTDGDIASLVQRAEEVSRGRSAPFRTGGTVFNRDTTNPVPADTNAPGQSGDAQGATQGRIVTEDNMPPERDGSTRLYHGGHDENFLAVPGGGPFDGFFAHVSKRSSWGAHGSGKNYFADIPSDRVLSDYELNYDTPYADSLQAFTKVTGIREGDENFDAAWAAVIEDKGNDYAEEANFSDAILDDPGLIAQKYRGRVAKELGFQAVEMSDEHGTSWLIVPGVPLTRVVPNDQAAPMSEGARFSRSAGTAKTTAQRQVTQAVRNTVADFLGDAGAKVSWWDKTLGTQYAKAQKFPAFKRVFDQVQQYQEDVSSLANEAANGAPNILPKLETWKDLKRAGLSDADAKAIAGPVFTGTLSDEKVYSDGELRSKFNLNDKQIGLYREFLSTVNTSLDQVVAADLVRLLGDKNPALQELAVTDRAALQTGVDDFLSDQIEQAADDPENQQSLTELRQQIRDKYKRIADLKAKGYSPLMRFGKYAVNVADPETGESLFFGLYESRADSNRMARELGEDPAFKGKTLTQGVLSAEQYKLFQGVPMESLEMFANAIGADQSAVFQEYLKLAKNNRSALKRLIKRKGTAGFSEDVPRVLAAFATSNARLASGAMNWTKANEAAQDIRDGDVKDEAIKLIDEVQNPGERANLARGLMFANFIGGSIASAVVNITQPLTMTLPYLTQWGGMAKASARMLSATKMAASGKIDDLALKVALKRAEADGIVSPQEIHYLTSQAMGSWGNNQYLKKAAFIWGAPFSLAEQFNRRVTFIAAYQTAKAEGLSDPFGFAEKAVTETQGLYNKGNAPNITRSAIGASAFTFRQFSVHYMEWLARMWKSGPEGKKAVGIALALLILAAGSDGLPFADDLDDLIDTIAQSLGYDLNSKKARREFVANSLGLGDAGADVAARGLSAVAGFPMDVSLRMSMGNLIPGTGILLRSNTDKSNDLLEVAGPLGGLTKQYLTAGQALLRGDVGGAVQAAVPVAIQNAIKGTSMWATGEARDTLGRKVMDVDGLDAVVKGIGFNPAPIARESQKVQMIRRSEQLAKNVEGEIAGEWARAIVDKDQDAIAEARAKLADWNENNPESRIRITMQQLIQRAKKLRETRAQRFITTVAPERRRAVAEELQ